jgi:hypothetical protein
MANDLLIPAIFFIIAFAFGTLTWIARNVWIDKKKTQFFAFIAIMATLGLILWALIYL